MGLEELPVTLVEMLRERGIKDREIEDAWMGGTIHFLAVDQLLGSPSDRKTAQDVAASAGLEIPKLRKLWRALGLTDFDDDDKVFTELDVQAAQSLKTLLGSGTTSDEVVLQLARVMGSAMARFSEAQLVASSAFGDQFGDVDPIELADRFTRYSAATVPAVPQLLVYAWLRHLHASSRRVMLAFDRGAENVSVVELAVGFVDLVGFTVLSQQLSNDELARVVQRFEETSFDVVASHGGRVVKMIGDEVMFVVESAEAACEIGVELAQVYAKDENLSDVRAGIAAGTALAQDGDYYGTLVNTASRIVNIAVPGTVLVTESVRIQVSDRSDFVFKALRPRHLKDIGSVQLYVVRRAPDVSGDA